MRPAALTAAGLVLVGGASGVLAGGWLRQAPDRTQQVAVAPGGEVSDAAEPTPAQERAAVQLVATDDLLTQVLPAVLAGTLVGRRVAVIAVTEAATATADTVSADLEAAGATPSLRLTLLDGWVDDNLAVLRDGLAGQLGGDSLTAVLADEAAAGEPSTVSQAIVGAGLAEFGPAPTVAPAEAAVPDAPAPDVSATSRPSDVVTVIVAPPGLAPDAAARWTQVVAAWRAQAGPGRLVLVGQEAVPTPGATATPMSVVLAVREGPLAATVPTIDHAATSIGRVTLVRTVARLPMGSVGHYGLLEGAEATVPGP